MACNSFRVAGELPKARASCERALRALVDAGRVASGDALVLRLNLVGIALASGNLVDAERLFAEIDRVGSADAEPYQHLVSLVFRGQMDYRRGRTSAALASLEAAARIQGRILPDNAELISNIGPQRARALVVLGRLDEA